MDDLRQQVAFIVEIDRLKAVYRKTRVKADHNRPENSAEHSWQIALSAQVLKAYAEQPVDIQRVVCMLLIHDIVEIDAGDLFAFENQALQDAQQEKEIRAAQRIFGLLPIDQSVQMQALWNEFEAAQSADARFAKSIDRLLPLILNMANQGGSWAENKVSKQQVIKRNGYLQTLSPKLFSYALEQIDIACDRGWLLDD